MTTFAWVMTLVVLFLLGQFMLMRPTPHERTLMRLRETARKLGLQPHLVPSPEWLKRRHPGMVPCYSLVLPENRLPAWRAETDENGELKSRAPGIDLLRGEAPPVLLAGHVWALEGEGNSLSVYWDEELEEPALPVMKAWLESLAARA